MFFAIFSSFVFCLSSEKGQLIYATKKGQGLPLDAVNPRPPVFPVSQFRINIRQGDLQLNLFVDLLTRLRYYRLEGGRFE
jgi:hypothetical protein